MSLIVLFSIIHEFHFTISASFKLYLQYFSKKFLVSTKLFPNGPVMELLPVAVGMTPKSQAYNYYYQ